MAASGSTFLLLNACHAALQLTAVRVAATFWCISCKSVSQRTLSRPSAILTDMTATSLPSVIDMCISIWRMHVHADRCPQVYRRRPDSCRLRIWHKGPNNKATQTRYPRHTREHKNTHTSKPRTTSPKPHVAVPRPRNANPKPQKWNPRPQNWKPKPQNGRPKPQDWNPEPQSWNPEPQPKGYRKLKQLRSENPIAENKWSGLLILKHLCSTKPLTLLFKF